MKKLNREYLAGISMSGAVGAACLLLSVQTAIAQEVYKVTLSDGSVIYSDSPSQQTSSAEVVEVPPEPSPERVAAAKQRIQELQTVVDNNASGKSAESTANTSESEVDSLASPPPAKPTPFIGVAPFL